MFQEYRIVLRHNQRPEPSSSLSPEFISVVIADDLEGAKQEAARLVKILKGSVSVVSISPSNSAPRINP